MKQKVLVKHLIITLIIIVYYSVIKILGFTCLIKGVIKIPCPACGTSRALKALAHGDFKGYFYYHPAALLLVITFFLAIHKDSIFNKVNKRALNIFVIVSSIIIMVLYFYRLIFTEIP